MEKGMRKVLFIAFIGLAVFGGCAKSSVKSQNETSKKYLEAWLQLYHTDAKETPLGAYVLADIPGSGKKVGDAATNPYVRAYYTVMTLDGDVTATNVDLLAQRVGLFDESGYYGPEVWLRSTVLSGIDESLSQMNVGGERTVLVPGWLATTDRYSTRDEYFNNVTNGSEKIYHLNVVEAIPDIVKWEADSVCAYVGRNYPSKSLSDSLKLGYYYIRTREPVDTAAFPADSTFKINYIGRLLNGDVFDTTIRDTAEFYGLSRSATYKPQTIKCGDEYTDYTMGGSSNLIDGFSYALYHMRPGESCSVVFISKYGYTENGKGSKIKGYTPLRFDIEIVNE